MDVRVRNKKTKQVKTLPISVYRNINQSKWELLSENEQAITPIPPIGDVKKNELKENATPAETGNSLESKEPSDADQLRAEYENLSGIKPDKRWGIEKLKSKIEELKNATNEG